MRQAQDLAETAGEDYLRNDTDPSIAIGKLKDKLFSDAFLDLVVAQTNHYIFRHLFNGQEDKRIEYPVADAKKVKVLMQADNGGKAEKVASVWSRDLPYRTPHQKFGGVRNERGEQLDDTGIPVLCEPKLAADSMASKHAADTYNRSLLAADLLEQEAFEKRAAVAQAIDDLKEHIKSAARSGTDIFDACAAIVGGCAPEKRAAASAISDFCVQQLLYDRQVTPRQFSQYASMTKTASLDTLGNGFVVHRGGDQLILQLNTAIGYMEDSDGDRGVVRPAKDKGHVLLGMVDDNIPYRVQRIAKPRTSRSFVQRDSGIL